MTERIPSDTVVRFGHQNGRRIPRHKPRDPQGESERQNQDLRS
jgi:hypothetical protein